MTDNPIDDFYNDYNFIACQRSGSQAVINNEIDEAYLPIIAADRRELKNTLLLFYLLGRCGVVRGFNNLTTSGMDILPPYWKQPDDDQ